MNKRGGINLEFLAWVITAITGTVAWSYNTFLSKDTAAAYRAARDQHAMNVDKRLERIELKLDCALGTKGACVK